MAIIYIAGINHFLDYWQQKKNFFQLLAIIVNFY